MALVLSTSIDDDGNPVPSTDCYPDYAEDVHSEEPFGPNNEWTFSKTKAPKMHGWVADYGTDAFVTELSRNPVVAVEQIRYMDENGYIDQQTSAIITTINTFNPNINYFCSSVFVCFPPPYNHAFLVVGFTRFLYSQITEFPIGGDATVDIYIRPFKSD